MLRTLLLLALVVTAGCDSGDDPADLTLDTAFLADGAWTFEAVTVPNADENTAAVNALLDAYTLDFDTDGTVRVAADFSDAVRDEDTEDFDLVTTYALSGASLQFRPAEPGTLPPYAVAVVDRDRMDLTNTGLASESLLGLDLEISLGTPSTVRLVRR